MRDLISPKTRTEFREYFVSTTLAVIDDAFRSEGFTADLDFEPPVRGQRRTLVEQYYKNINWRSPADASRVLRIFGAILVELDLMASRPGMNAEWALQEAKALRRWLELDGITEKDGKLSLPASSDIAIGLHRIDAPVLRRQIRRIQESVDEDPSLAIGTAKELLETTCKTILSDRRILIDKNWDVPRLVKEARKALTLVPSDIPDAAKGADSIRRLLSNLGTIANSLAELRNLYGTGHGTHGRARGVHPRHARLAVGAAATLATFLFETHEARDSDHTGNGRDARSEKRGS